MHICAHAVPSRSGGALFLCWPRPIVARDRGGAGPARKFNFQTLRSHVNEGRAFYRETKGALRSFLLWYTPSLSAFVFVLWQFLVAYPKFIPAAIPLLLLGILEYTWHFGETSPERQESVVCRPWRLALLASLLFGTSPSATPAKPDAGADDDDDEAAAVDADSALSALLAHVAAQEDKAEAGDADNDSSENDSADEDVGGDAAGGAAARGSGGDGGGGRGGPPPLRKGTSRRENLRLRSRRRQRRFLEGKRRTFKQERWRMKEEAMAIIDAEAAGTVNEEIAHVTSSTKLFRPLVRMLSPWQFCAPPAAPPAPPPAPPPPAPAHDLRPQRVASRPLALSPSRPPLTPLVSRSPRRRVALHTRGTSHDPLEGPDPDLLALPAARHPFARLWSDRTVGVGRSAVATRFRVARAAHWLRSLRPPHVPGRPATEGQS